MRLILLSVACLGLTLTARLARAEEGIVIKPIDNVERTEFAERQSKKQFCSKDSEADAQAKCNRWIEEQKKNLGDKVLTTFCSDGEIGDAQGCLYRSSGEVTYQIVKKEVNHR